MCESARMVEKVLMLLRNDFSTDPRATKMAGAIKSCGFLVTVLSFINDTPDNHTVDPLCGINVIYHSSGVSNAKKVIEYHKDTVSPTKTLDRTLLAFFYLLFINIKFIYKSIPTLQGNRYKVVHANDLDTLPAAYILSRLRGSKLIYDAHELFNELYSDYTPALKKFLFILEKVLVKKCDYVFTVNDAIAKEFIDRYGVTPMVVMNCPYYSKIYRSGGSKRNPKVIYLGSYQEERCIDALIRSVAFWDSGKLYLRGWGPIEGELRAVVDGTNVEGECEFLTPVKMEDIVDSLTEFDIGVVPYPPYKTLNNKYSSPNKIFEYMMAGVIPLVPTGATVLEAIADEIGIPHRFRACDPISISNAMNALTIDPKYEEYRDMCLELALKYRWEVQSLPVIETYCSI